MILLSSREDIKLTKLSSCGGCGAKVGAGVLAKILEDIKVNGDPNLLVGFDKSDDAAVYRINDDLALVQTVDFFLPIAGGHSIIAPEPKYGLSVTGFVNPKMVLIKQQCASE